MRSAMLTVFWLTITLFIVHANSQDIIFASEDDQICEKRASGNSICKDHRSCPEAFKNIPAVFPVLCGFQGNHPKVCCSVKIDRLKKPDVSVPILDISPPFIDFKCGDSISSLVLVGLPSNAPLPEDLVDVAGGEIAREVIAKYTALIGFRFPNGKIDWFCTGVLLNRKWVLTAAHCNIREINIIRLGEHNYNDSFDGALTQEFGVIENVPYPEYKDPEGYHDLALVKLSSEATLGSTINPLCLPWGDASDKNLTNQKVTVAGWGTTEFGGALSPVLQEVNVTVFNTSVCEKSYSQLRNYKLEWPRGIGEDILCAGDAEGGKDACQGDSGGPMTYLNEDDRYVLAGVVSRGYGCALKEYPGIYANVHHKPYLAWIKNIAFQLNETFQMEENDLLQMEENASLQMEENDSLQMEKNDLLQMEENESLQLEENETAHVEENNKDKKKNRKGRN